MNFNDELYNNRLFNRNNIKIRQQQARQGGHIQHNVERYPSLTGNYPPQAMIPKKPKFNLRDNQKLPEGDWSCWLILAGRGFGKTLAGSSAVAQLMKEKKAMRVALISETLHDARHVMIEGPSGLLQHFDNAKYLVSLREIRLPNGSTCHFFGADNPDSLRGFQFDLVWIDEFAKFKRPEELWMQVNMCLRIGISKSIITTTPRGIGILKSIMRQSGTIVTKGSSYDNKENLSANFFNYVDEHKDSEWAKQEVYGELIECQSLWSAETIRYKECEKVDRYVLGIDPAIGSGTTGIVLVAYDKNNVAYVVEDYSTEKSAKYWMETVAEITNNLNGLVKINIEINQGGEILLNSLRMYGVQCQIRACRAELSKEARNLPTQLMYQRKQVFHTKPLLQLEREMLNRPKDRVDALTWALSDIRKFNMEVR